MSHSHAIPSSDKLLKKALKKHNAGDTGAAKTLYQRLIRKNPTHLDAHYLLGTLYSELNDHNNALRYLTKAAELAPSSPFTQNNLGNVYLKTECLIEAADCYRKALQTDPKMMESNFNLGQVLVKVGNFTEAATYFEKAIYFNPSFLPAHVELAKLHKHSGKLEEATAGFRKALSLDPESVALLHELANVLASQDKHAEAIECFERILELNPGNSSATHALSALTGETTDAAPKKHVEELFDNLAPTFEQHLNELDYRVPQRLHALLLETSGAGIRFTNALDLGCGTGLSGQRFHAMTERLTGVDLSSSMVEVAKEKSIYDNLHTEDITEYLNRSSEKYDLIIATDVFVYLGNLKPLFEAVAHQCMENARFLFSIEQSEAEEYKILSTGRYAHSASYIETLQNQCGFSLEASRPVEIRKESSKSIMGRIYILSLRPLDSAAI